MTTPPTNIDSVTDEKDRNLLLAIGIELARSDGPFTPITSSIAIRPTEYVFTVKGLRNVYATTLTPRQWKIPPDDKPRVTTAKYATEEGAVVIIVMKMTAYSAMCSMEQRASSSGSHDGESGRPLKRKRS